MSKFCVVKMENMGTKRFGSHRKLDCLEYAPDTLKKSIFNSSVTIFNREYSIHDISGKRKYNFGESFPTFTWKKNHRDVS